MREPVPTALLAASCMGLSVLLLMTWGLTVQRLRLRQFVDRMQAATAGTAHTGRYPPRRPAVEAARRILGLDLSLAGLCGLFGLSAVTGLGFAELAGLWGWQSLAGAAAGPLVLIAWRLNVMSRQAEALSRQTHGVLHEMHLAAAGGETPTKAFAQALTRTKEPLRPLLYEAFRAHAAGEPLVLALGRLGQLARCWEYRMLLDALRLHAETECSLNQLLAETVERADEALLSRCELRAKLGEARWTAWILALVPVFLVAYMALFNPWAIAPLTEDPAGRSGLFLGGLLWLGGIVIAGRLQRVPDRLRAWS